MKTLKKRKIVIITAVVLCMAVMSIGVIAAASPTEPTNDSCCAVVNGTDYTVNTYDPPVGIQPLFRCNHSCGGIFSWFFSICNCSTAWSCNQFGTSRCPR